MVRMCVVRGFQFLTKEIAHLEDSNLNKHIKMIMKNYSKSVNFSSNCENDDDESLSSVVDL